MGFPGPRPPRGRRFHIDLSLVSLGGRLHADLAGVQTLHPFELAGLGASLALIGGSLALIAGSFALIGQAFALVGSPVALVGQPFTSGELALALLDFLAIRRGVVAGCAHRAVAAP